MSETGAAPRGLFSAFKLCTRCSLSLEHPSCRPFSGGLECASSHSYLFCGQCFSLSLRLQALGAEACTPGSALRRGSANTC